VHLLTTCRHAAQMPRRSLHKAQLVHTRSTVARLNVWPHARASGVAGVPASQPKGSIETGSSSRASMQLSGSGSAVTEATVTSRARSLYGQDYAT
jgi:hypothetical protein